MFSDFKTFTNKGCKIVAQIRVCFWTNFGLMSRIFLVSVFLTPFNDVFAPTSWNQMSKLFWFSEFLGKSDLTKNLLLKGAKSTWQKKSFFTDFVNFSLRLSVFLSPFCKVQCPNFLDFWNLWRKVMERRGLRFENFCL